MKSFRSYIPILRLVLVLAAAGFLFPAAAHDDAVEEAPWLALQDFSAVEIPDEFNVGEKFKWGAKALFSHKDVKEIVPVSAYKLEDVCNEDPNRQPTTTSAEIGTLVFHIQSSIDEATKTTATAVWSQSLKEACELDWVESGNVDTVTQFGDTMTWKVNNSALGLQRTFLPLLTHLSKQGSNDYILTVGQLNNVDVAPTSEYWWRCRVDHLPAQNSVCRATLAASPYKQHKNIARPCTHHCGNRPLICGSL